MDITEVLAGYTHDATSDELEASLDGVKEYLDVVRAAAQSRDFVDLALATQITDVLTALVHDAAEYTARERSLLAGAIAYFIDADDENSDLNSPTGLEDDAEVLNAVCRFLGRGDLTLAIG